jgi:uncharacterized Fe-S radical SAM superfamily protein PflX
VPTPPDNARQCGRNTGNHDLDHRELGPETYVNLMAQYHPACRVAETEYPEINRCISPSELEQAVDAFRSAGLSRLDHSQRSSNCSEATRYATCSKPND